jgi:hypothetical protein
MTSTPAVTRPLHILEVHTRGLVVEARLNDIPVFTERAGRGRLFQAKCEPYLLTGENELRLWLRLLGGSLVDDEAREADPVKAPYCRVRLVRLDPARVGVEPASATAAVGDDPPVAADASSVAPSGATTGISDAPRSETVLPHDLAAWVWDPDHNPLLPGRIFEAGPWFFVAESPAGRWSWEQAPPYQPSSEDPAEIRVLVDRLWRAVSSLDVEAVVRLTREKTRELAVALGVNAAELELDQAGYLSSLFASPGWMIAPLEQEAIVLEPAARGRLVDVRTVDGEAPIRGGDGKRSFIIRPMVAKIEDRWRVVR